MILIQYWKHKMKCIQIENEVKTINTMRHQTIYKWKGAAAAAQGWDPRGRGDPPLPPYPFICLWFDVSLYWSFSLKLNGKSSYLLTKILILYLTCNNSFRNHFISFDLLQFMTFGPLLCPFIFKFSYSGWGLSYCMGINSSAYCQDARARVDWCPISWKSCCF